MGFPINDDENTVGRLTKTPRDDAGNRTGPDVPLSAADLAGPASFSVDRPDLVTLTPADDGVSFAVATIPNQPDGALPADFTVTGAGTLSGGAAFSVPFVFSESLTAEAADEDTVGIAVDTPQHN